MNKAIRLGIQVCALAALSTAAAVAHAGAGIYDPSNNCDSANCSASTIYGSYILDGSNSSLPFTIDVFTAGSECLRLDISGTTPSTADLRATLVCPNGQVFRNDDRASNNTRPLIKARPTGAGWCSLSISHYSGGGVDTDFTLRVGRYPFNNTNCSSPTGSLDVDDEVRAKSKSLSDAEQPDSEKK
ncbi:MAG: hypothetical protein M3O62_18895 [Pseudomonadota bacterium]|nr:hypothetical protein [Pseudomonadota bacterium]